MKRICISSCAIVMALAGCQTFAPAGEKTIAVDTTVDEGPITLGDGDKTLDPIVDARLPDGACGMILWTLESQRPVAIFRYVAGNTAQVNIGGRMAELTLGDFSGRSDFGIYEQQVFRSDGGVEVSVDASFGRGFEGGAYLERGLIKVRDASGWSIVAPAAGVAGCRPK